MEEHRRRDPVKEKLEGDYRFLSSQKWTLFIEHTDFLRKKINVFFCNYNCLFGFVHGVHVSIEKQIKGDDASKCE